MNVSEILKTRANLRGFELLIRQIKEYDSWRDSVLERDRCRSVLSGDPDDLVVHHVIPLRKLIEEFLMSLDGNLEEGEALSLAKTHRPFWIIKNGATVTQEEHSRLHSRPVYYNEKVCQALREKEHITSDDVVLLSSGLPTKQEMLEEHKGIIQDLYINGSMGLTELCRVLSEKCGLRMTVGNVHRFIKDKMNFTRSIQEACFHRRKISDEELVEMHVNQGLNGSVIARQVGMSRVSVYARLGSIGCKGGK